MLPMIVKLKVQIYDLSLMEVRLFYSLYFEYNYGHVVRITSTFGNLYIEPDNTENKLETIEGWTASDVLLLLRIAIRTTITQIKPRFKDFIELDREFQEFYRKYHIVLEANTKEQNEIESFQMFKKLAPIVSKYDIEFDIDIEYDLSDDSETYILTLYYKDGQQKVSEMTIDRTYEAFTIHNGEILGRPSGFSDNDYQEIVKICLPVKWQPHL